MVVLASAFFYKSGFYNLFIFWAKISGELILSEEEEEELEEREESEQEDTYEEEREEGGDCLPEFEVEALGD